VGYAAETHDALANAREKFARKNLDLLVLNEITAENPAFNVEHNQVHLLSAAGTTRLDKMEKSALAARIWDEIFRIKKQK
jgi:phosphopantothenoylcysteine decarboxylase/phosphopantothenate--cysteine ligase